MWAKLLLFSEVLSPKSRQSRQSQQAWRYFKPGSKADLRRVLPDWPRVERRTVGRCGQHEHDIKKHQYSPQPRLSKSLCRVPN